ncbi:hypothetical protein [Novosphingobium cyanobacteriorum]|uniref:Uncharacterized protein n=1 Tax=Novosphingobium cyanobacteriorum TaxID=3024215 RepID=A0ABT6CIY2_9SPHN|nr:hypothetical protein [Novosphingobium cyanobacteriorum]MDF8333879.1 hypothetical protein [Novosphingobium cyanobacteriorum]
MLIMVLAAAAATLAPADVHFRREYRAAPRAVRAFLIRRAGCNHWGGEEGYDADRARQIADAARQLRCNRIEADERRIKRRYAKSRRVRWLLATSRDWDTLP